MVISRIRGGLGNQLFQYAVGFTLANALETELKLDVSEFETYVLHRYALPNLSIRAIPATAKEIARCRPRKTILLRKVAGMIGVVDKSPVVIVKEKSFRFDPSVMQQRGQVVYLDGYWQSERYFEANAADIRREFRVSLAPEGKNQEMLTRIKSQESVGVHIRRGDYVTNKQTSGIHGTPPLEYYHQALEFVRARVRNLNLFVFSDDMEWVRQNFQTGFPTTLVDQNGAERNFEDLRLMSGCRHHIIANSTFSWWGAWLGEHIGQIVVAPKKWFATEARDSKDIVPARWFQV